MADDIFLKRAIFGFSGILVYHGIPYCQTNSNDGKFLKVSERSHRQCLFVLNLENPETPTQVLQPAKRVAT